MKTPQGEDRDPFDRYFTPLNFARAHVRHLIEEGYIRNGSVIIDAGCGDGAYLRALEIESKIHGISITILGVELDRSLEQKCSSTTKVVHQSFLEWTVEGDLVIGNPPFTLAELFIRHALKACPVSFLLQSQFVSGGKRYASGLWKGLERVDPFTTRPKFYGPAIDAINERRKKEGKKPAGGNAVDYSSITWSPHASGRDFKGRHIVASLASEEDPE